MKYNKGSVLTILGITIYFIQACTSAKCWNCRSDVDPNCADPFNNETFAIADCTILNQYDWQGHEVDTTTCIKIAQKSNGNTVTIRRCAFYNETGNYPEQKNTCTYKEGVDSLTLNNCRPNECQLTYCSTCTAQYCSCDNKDGCNSGTVIRISNYLNILVVFMGLSYFVKL